MNYDVYIHDDDMSEGIDIATAAITAALSGLVHVQDLDTAMSDSTAYVFTEQPVTPEEAHKLYTEWLEENQA